MNLKILNFFWLLINLQKLQFAELFISPNDNFKKQIITLYWTVLVLSSKWLRHFYVSWLMWHDSYFLSTFKQPFLKAIELSSHETFFWNYPYSEYICANLLAYSNLAKSKCYSDITIQYLHNQTSKRKIVD